MAAPNFLIRLPPTESQQIPQTQELSKQALSFKGKEERPSRAKLLPLAPSQPVTVTVPR
jgi:hypothetical protein